MASDILVVDDEEDIREIVSGILSDEGHETRTAYDSDSALAAISDRVPRLVFLDIWMQGSKLDGLSLLDEIKSRHPDLPVVMISGHGNIETAVSAIRRGAFDFIEKPFDEADLRAQVEKMLSKARAEASSQREQQAAEELLSKLTSREHQVLERIIAGRLNKQIADDLGISIKTVEAHRANIMEKLNVNTVADLLRLALSKRSSSAPRP